MSPRLLKSYSLRFTLSVALSLLLLALLRGGLGAQTWPAALMVDGTFDANGNTLVTDSFDSSDLSKSYFGMYDPTKAGDNGSIVCNGSLVAIGNGNVFGYVETGSNGIVSIGPGGGIGSHVFQLSNPGQVEPGWTSHDSHFMPPRMLLSYSSGLPLGPPMDIVITNYTITTNGTGYVTNAFYSTNHYDYTMSSGDYYVDYWFGGDLYVGSTARLVIANGLNMSGADSITIGNNGSLTVYSGGTLNTIGGNGIANRAYHAQNFVLYCAPTVTNLTFNSNGQFIGVIVAPQANAVLNGAGNTANDFMGALMARSVHLNGHYLFHYDEYIASITIHGFPVIIPPLILPPAAATIRAPATTGYPNSLLVIGATGYNYAIEASTNLTDWARLQTNPAPFLFTDTARTNYPQRFYRAVLIN
jgi:hypothetical protein